MKNYYGLVVLLAYGLFLVGYTGAVSEGFYEAMGGSGSTVGDRSLLILILSTVLSFWAAYLYWSVKRKNPGSNMLINMFFIAVPGLVFLYFTVSSLLIPGYV